MCYFCDKFPQEIFIEATAWMNNSKPYGIIWVMTWDIFMVIFMRDRMLIAIN